jgi:predicted nucleic acid-binding protein
MAPQVKGLFVDTGGWLALADAREPLHERARDARDRWLEEGGLLVSTDFVLDETLTVIRARLGLASARRWWEEVDASRRVRWEWIDPPRVRRALAVFFRWKDKPFSFTDCTSFEVMRELGLVRALTPDRHFRHAGFETVP